MSRPLSLRLLAAGLLLAGSPGAADACPVHGKASPVCDSATGGWAFEKGKYCVAKSFCPANRTALPAAPTRDAPVDSKANARTRAVYTYLRSVWGKQIIAGQQ